MSTWSSWQLNIQRSNADQSQFHVYRGMKNGDNWDYDTRTYPRSLFSDSQALLTYLRTQEREQAVAAAQQNQGQQEAADVVAGLQNLQIASNNPFNNRLPTANGQGYNPFRGHTNHGRSNGTNPAQLPRATTPGPNHLAQHRYNGNHGQVGGPVQPHQVNGAYGQYGYATPGLPAAHVPQFGGPLQNPRNIARSATAAPSQTRRSSSRSHHTPPNTRHFKLIKPKDQRSYFKAGRIFKALWQETSGQNPGSHNPFGEIIRFLVLRPHKRHSLCLALHTYHNQATTAKHVRARDHVVIHSSERVPTLVPGEDDVILKRDPLKVTLEPKGESLMPTSRLNLAKIYTVEHNIPTFPVGKISSRDVERVKQYCLDVQGLFSNLASASQDLDDVDEDDEAKES